jgi:hypothetical protein
MPGSQIPCGQACCDTPRQLCNGAKVCVAADPLAPSSPAPAGATAPAGSPRPSPSPIPSPSPAPGGSGGSTPAAPPPPPPPADGGGAPPAPAPPPPDPSTFACGVKEQCQKGQNCIKYDDKGEDVECCEFFCWFLFVLLLSRSLSRPLTPSLPPETPTQKTTGSPQQTCQIDSVYTECCSDDMACVIDDGDDSGKAKVCEEKKNVCGGRSSCSPDDGSVCVGGKVCCWDSSETPCDPSGATTRLCCELAVDECRKDGSGEWDCYSKDDADGGAPAPPPPKPPAGRRKLLRTPAWALPQRQQQPSESKPSERSRRRQQKLDLDTPEGRARRREARLAARRGLSPAEQALPPWARAAAAAGRPPVVVTTWEDAQKREQEHQQVQMTR